MTVKKRSNRNAAIEEVRKLVASFRERREQAKDIKESVDKDQPILISTLQSLGVTNEVGVVYDPDDESKGAAYVQQNKGSEVWDEEAILDYVRGNKTLWMSVSSRVLDLRKFEAEVANGNIPAKVAKKLKTQQPAPKPFIRFGKITEDSL